MYPVDSSSVAWYAVQTKPQEELRATHNLNNWSVETFAPTWRQHQYNRLRGNISSTLRPLFPGYIFARFDVLKSLRKINNTRGVLRVVSFGNRPVPIHEEIIEFIRARVKDGVVEMDDHFQAGDRVRIKEGPLAGLVGIFQRNAGSNDRVSVLMTTIKYQSHVTIDRQLIEKH